MLKRIILILCLCLIPTSVFSHSWYPKECCSDDDCKPVACEKITVHSDGSASYNGLKFNKGVVKPTPDHECHACVLTVEGENIPMCVFIKQPSF